MRGRAFSLVLLTALGLAVAGCSPCGFIWDDWRYGKSCRADPAPPK
jgi:hypothetical protein